MSTTENVPNEDRALSRRALLSRSALTVVLAGSVEGLFGTSAAQGKPNKPGKPGAPGYGELVPDPAGRLSLPEGFSYVVVAEAGKTMLESGEFTPSDADGTASFVRHGGNGSVLVMNHEISGREPFPVPAIPGFVYDGTVGGGTTTIEVDKDGKRVSEVVSLAGTLNNCAGGRTPWETWLSCEETESIKAKRHGYVFEVDPYDQEANRDPQPILALGRFAHESVVVDPGTGVIYQTEDASNPNGLLFRWTPPAEAQPVGKGTLKALSPEAGTLEALKASTLAGAHVPDLSVAVEPGTTYKCAWVNVPDRDATTSSLRKKFTSDQVTRSRKLEGMWWGDGGAYFVASFARTSDGSAVAHDGQVWFIDPLADTIELKLRFAYTPNDQDNDPDGPDNITVSPYGGVILAEDGEGVNHLVGSTDSGEVFFFARNDASDSEFTGPTFSRNKKTLFANVQSPGITYAITGPFTKQR